MNSINLELKNLEELTNFILEKYLDLKDQKNKIFSQNENYIFSLNQIVKNLIDFYGFKEVKNILESEFFSINNEKELIIKKDISNNLIWESFFENLFIKKKYKWLEFIESFVLNFSKMYNLKIPELYNYKILNFLNNYSILEKDNIDKLNKLINLEKKIYNYSVEKYKIDNTIFFSNSYFREYFINKLNKTNFINNNNYFLFFSLNKNINFFKDEIKPSVILDELINDIDDLYMESYLFYQISENLFTVYEENSKHENILLLKNKIISKFNKSNYNEKYSLNHLITNLKEQDILNCSNDEIIDELIDFVYSNIHAEKPHKSYNNNKNSLFNNILVIEHEKLNIDIIKSTFANDPINLFFVNDAYKAIEVIKKNSIDLIITVKNPLKLDAFKMKAHIDENINKKLNYIFLCEYKNDDIIKKVYYSGFNFFIKKPYYKEELYFVTKQLLKR